MRHHTFIPPLYMAVNTVHGSDKLLGQRHWIVNSRDNFFSMKETQLSAMAGNQYTHTHTNHIEIVVTCVDAALPIPEVQEVI